MFGLTNGLFRALMITIHGGEQMTSYLTRYLQGEYTQVWEELVELGDQVREEPVYADAWAVAQETMRRVRHNLELAIPRLQALGYVFIHDWMATQPDGSSRIEQEEFLGFYLEEEWVESNPPLRTEPSVDIIEQLDAFEREIGPLPLSLRAFYQEVGGINFVGHHPEWEALAAEYNPFYLPPDGLDPVYVFSFERELIEEIDNDPFMVPYPDTPEPFATHPESQEANEDRGQANKPSYMAVIAPDYYHKMNASGSGAYNIPVPNAAADALLLDEWHNTTFVNYLRISCYYAGLPGLERIRSELSNELHFLRAGMLPI
jgi:hypothetical protein